MVVGWAGRATAFPREDGFDIVVASEVMAIFCLATSRKDLKQRLGNIIVGYTRAHAPVRARDLNAQGAMAALLKDAIKPNLVQTLENNPAIIHGGPFANIAHGCNTVTATRAALKLGDYVVTEAGFGADLGAEKFIDIKCRKSGLRPDCAVVVATVRALKHHGGVGAKDLNHARPGGTGARPGQPGAACAQHPHHYGLPCVVSINHFTSATPSKNWTCCAATWTAQGVPVVLARHWAEGSAGAEELARVVVRAGRVGQCADALCLCRRRQAVGQDAGHCNPHLWRRGHFGRCRGARAGSSKLQQDGYGHYPVCVAKTQYSFSTDPGCGRAIRPCGQRARGAPGRRGRVRRDDLR
jgi:formate--tetrahydrofolate ligase